MRYYLDTCIWIDAYEDRRGFNGELHGQFALHLLVRILERRDSLVISDVVLQELCRYFSATEFQAVFSAFTDILVMVPITNDDEARRLARERGIPIADALHAIIARDHADCLVTRDAHFRLLTDVCPYFLPEDLF